MQMPDGTGSAVGLSLTGACTTATSVGGVRWCAAWYRQNVSAVRLCLL